MRRPSAINVSPLRVTHEFGFPDRTPRCGMQLALTRSAHPVSSILNIAADCGDFAVKTFLGLD